MSVIPACISAANVADTCRVKECGNGGRVGLRTNLLFDAATVLNLGVIVDMGRNWSLAVDGHYANWSKASQARYMRVQGAELTVRKAFRNTPRFYKPLVLRKLSTAIQI